MVRSLELLVTLFRLLFLNGNNTLKEHFFKRYNWFMYLRWSSGFFNQEKSIHMCQQTRLIMKYILADFWCFSYSPDRQ